MKVSTSDVLTKTPLLFVFAMEGQALRLPEGVKVPAGFSKNFSAKARELRETWASAGPAERIVLVGLGPLAELDNEGLRRASAVAIQAAEAAKTPKASLWLGTSLEKTKLAPLHVGRSITEGAILGCYTFQAGKSKPEKSSCKTLVLVGADAETKRGVRVGTAMAEANAFTRDLQNEAGNRMTPRDMAAAAKKVAARSPQIQAKILDEKAMAALGMGLLLGVSQGSTEPARLIHLVYKPKGKSRGKVCLVGKGLTFDAGGLSIKPSAKMDEMRYDMSGGAAVLGTFHGLAKLAVSFEVHGVVGSSENVIDGNATKPGDIHRAMNGKTVEVLNTDAEGRLLLADCLSYVGKKIKPDTILDLATLTGAVIVALGHELTGIYPSTDSLRDSLLAAGETVGERCWPLPLTQVHKDAMRGQVADFANIGSPAVGAGSSQGAAFLSHFVPEGTEWCHLDIAGTAWGSQPRDWVGGAQGSGVGTRLLLEYLLRR